MLKKIPVIIRKIPWTLWLAVLLAALLGLRSCWADEQQQREVSVVGYNYTQRPVSWFSVNGGAGSNIFINRGGGSASCCTLVTVGQLANVEWQASRTWEEIERGEPKKEIHLQRVVVPPPPTEHPQARYLEVHFYQDGHVELALVDFPGPRRLPDLPEEN